MVQKSWLFFIVFAAGLWAADDYSQWLYYRNISFNTKASGAGVSTTVKKFPVLVRLTLPDSLIFTTSKPGGADIRFSEAGNSAKHLPYQIERWDAVNKAAELWVLADSVKGNDSTQYLRMYWGNATVEDSQKSSTVFDIGNGFVGVWHLGEASGNAVDATVNGINDTAKGTIKYRKTGGVGYSDSLTGNGSYFKAGSQYNTLLNMSAGKKVTISAWVNRAGAAIAGTTEGIAGKYAWVGGATNNNREYLIANDGGFQFLLSSDGTGGANETILKSTVIPTIGLWYYVTGVMDGANMSIYINGAQKAIAPKTAISPTTAAPFKIGLSDDDGTKYRQYFNGEIDEVVVSNTNRSPDWIKLCYKNQKFAAGTDSLTKPGPVVLQPPSNLSYLRTQAYCPIGSAISPNTATVTGKVDSFTVNSPLPSGLNIDKVTGTISGTPIGPAFSVSETVTAWNAVGSAAFQLTLTVYALPSITLQPISDTVNVGDAAKFTITAVGGPPITYQWTKGGVAISGNASALSNALVLPNEQVLDDGAIFKCSVRYAATNDSAVSAPCMLRVKNPPVITLQPVSRTAIIDSSSFFVVKATGSMPLSYQWTKNGSAIGAPAGTTDTLRLTGVLSTDDNSLFLCRVKTSFGDSLWSAACTLHVIALPTAPVITQQPSSVIVKSGASATFVTIAGGAAPLSYRWIRNSGVDTTATPSDSLALTSVTGSMDNTVYKCLVGNVNGFAVSAPCTLHVSVGPAITLQPISKTVLSGATTIFAVKATGSAPLSYQWTKNGQGITGAAKDTLSLSAILAIDDATIYKCRVRNIYGDSALSAACTLHVLVLPAFTLQPRSLTAGAGTDVSFTVQATGAPSPSYRWIRNAADTIAGATAAILPLLSVQAKDDKSYYRCSAQNAAGTAQSALCTLRVVSAGFSGAPLTGIDSLTVSFTDQSTGGVNIYNWDFGDGAAGITANPMHTYTAPGSYTVKQTVSAAGIIQTALKTGYIVVNYLKPTAKFSADALQAPDSLLVHFTDQSTGKITGRKWVFGDGSAADTTLNPSHLYRDTGSFTVKLVVTGPGGSDSSVQANYIFIYSKSDNPIRIKGKRLSASGVEITFTNYLSIPTSDKVPFFPPFADTVGLWFKRGGLPLNPQSDSLLKKYSLILMKKSVSGVYKDTVAVPYSAPAVLAYYGFNTALTWNDGSKSPMKPGNGDSLLMQDTTKPDNGLTISGSYLGGDSAAIYIDGIASLDTTKDSTVGVWYGFKDSVNFSDKSYTRWFPIGAIITSAVKNRFTFILHEPLKFNGGDTLSVYAATAVEGKDQLQSVIKDTSFKAGRPRPDNPVRLFAAALNPTSIRLNWRNVTSGAALTGIDSIVIWSGVKPIPALNASVAGGYMAIIPLVTDTSLVKFGLNEKTRYYFGAQIYKNGLWSAVTANSSASDSTPAILDTARPVNSISAVSLTFDTTKNDIVVHWHIAASDTGDEAGIAYSLKSFPADTSKPPQQIVPVRTIADSAALTLNEPLAFDSTYYVSMWLRKNGGKWSLPTSTSTARIKLPAFVSWQTVVYFTKYPDTVSAFGGRVLLANDSGNVTPTQDKLIYNKVLTDSLNGFAPVSIGFSFQQKLASAPFHVGISFDTALIPKGYGASDIRIYHDSAGLWFVERGTIIDTSRRVAWVLTRKPDFPFIAMVDTMTPQIIVKSSIGDPVKGGVAVVDTFSLHDNVANMTWSYKYAKGEDSYASGDSVTGSLAATSASVIASIPGVMVNQNNGTRSLFIVGDGVHWDTADVSRQVYCDSALNVVTTAANAWYPLQVNTKLDSIGIKHALRNLAIPRGDWYYDDTKFRVFRWYGYEGNADSADKWVEYSDKTDWIFTFDIGKLIWIKTRKATTINLGSSITP
jgi:PKD repeat protein